ncbi:MAG: tryptophan synthase subunit alpha [Spirochaetaceae bacterium]|jgi:tryptophan synthase alpha chain|nr:tryptophan synthase subunit alpha [Spirochaetaceae bacterium]
MNNIARAFQGLDTNKAENFSSGKKTCAFIGFVTGGDPSIEKTEEFILEMISAGTDLVEIGIPFSDPVAEGPVIQEANIRALASGTTVEKLFAMTKRLRAKTQVPFVFLSYLNPVFHYGYDAFFARCRESGVDGIIIPDLPFEEQEEVRLPASRRDVSLISLIAPTSEERIRDIARAATGFLYVVSSMGVTGIRNEIRTDLASMILQVRKERPAPKKDGGSGPLPVAVGFGIHTPAQAAEIAGLADGVIVGSALVKIIARYGEGAGPHIYDYVKQMNLSLYAVP